jgi:tetratricopeptide (TPR) repeat protein
VRQQQGKFADAEALYRRALNLTRRRHGNDALEVAAPLRTLGGLLSYTGRAPEAQPLLEQAVAILRRTYGTNHPAVVDALVALSDAQGYRPDYAAAESTLREALPIAQTLYGREHPMVANVLGRLGTALASQGRTAEAEPLLRETLAMRIKLLGAPHPDVQLARIELARLLQQTGSLDEADTLATQALSARRALLGNGSPAVASSLLDVGLIAGLREDWPRAESTLRESASIWRAAGIPDEELYTLAALGQAIERQNRFAEADSVLAEVLKRRRALFGDGHWSVGDTYTKMAAVAVGRGNPARAESLAQRGLAIAQKVYGPKSPQTLPPRSAVVLAVEARGDTSAAIPLLREELSIMANRPRADLSVVNTRRALAIDLCATGAVAEGDSLLRATAELVPLDSTKVAPYRVRSALGFCLTRARRFDEADTLLLQAEERLGALAAPAARYRDQTVGWLVNLYDQWGKGDQAARWKDRAARRP